MKVDWKKYRALKLSDVIRPGDRHVLADDTMLPPFRKGRNSFVGLTVGQTGHFAVVRRKGNGI